MSIAFTLDPATIIQIVLTVVLPIVVGLVTTRVTDSAVKAWLLAGLTLATSLAAELLRAVQSGETYDLGVGLLAALPAFGLSVALHYGLLKPTGVAAAAQSVLVTADEGVEG